MSTLASHFAAFAAAVIAFAPGASQAAWEPSGTRSIFATTAEGTRIRLGVVEFTPAPDGASATFRVVLDAAPFVDHFLSMREFKCLPGGTELTCHVPYPHAHPGTVKPGDLAWLEHSLLFFHKSPSEFGAKLWNGIYFELQPAGAGLVGRPRAVDLNLIATPPASASTPPFRPALRHEMPAGSRWIRSLSIE
ncbi:MAG: hypothetical protein MUF03_01070 [Rubrivivax sp.]|jgi:hypothetical protein|nr:hypothetical protein [Rubrivivax sp.]